MTPGISSLTSSGWLVVVLLVRGALLVVVFPKTVYDLNELTLATRKVSVEIEMAEKYVTREYKTSKREINEIFEDPSELKFTQSYASGEYKETIIIEALKGESSLEMEGVLGQGGSGRGSAGPGLLGSSRRSARSSESEGMRCLVQPSCSNVDSASDMEGDRSVSSMYYILCVCMCVCIIFCMCVCVNDKYTPTDSNVFPQVFVLL